jgi:hypothetical protein
VNVHGLGLYEVQKCQGLIRVLRSFFYKDFPKILAKFGFIMGGYNAKLERDYYVSIMGNDFISNMETIGRQHMGVDSPIYLSIKNKDSFPYKENERWLDLEDFLYCFLSFLLQDFLTLKGHYGRLLKGKNSITLFSIFKNINSTK